MVNVTNFESPTEIPNDILKAIFEKQWEVAEKYVEIEKMGDLLTPARIATNFDTQLGQAWLKDFAWRVTEELGESFEAIYQHEELTDDLKLHYYEELADALHFFVELCLIAGIKSTDLTPIEEIEKNAWDGYDLVPGSVDYVQQAHWNVIYQLTLFCNCLKNKKWKQTQMMTDRPKAIGYLQASYKALILCFKNPGLTDADIYDMYFKKNQVNRFRQRSNY